MDFRTENGCMCLWWRVLSVKCCRADGLEALEDGVLASFWVEFGRILRTAEEGILEGGGVGLL